MPRFFADLQKALAGAGIFRMRGCLIVLACFLCIVKIRRKISAEIFRELYKLYKSLIFAGGFIMPL